MTTKQTNNNSPKFNLREIIENNITTDWKDIILDILNKNTEITEQIENKLNSDIDKKSQLKIFPPKELIFNAFNHFNFQDTKAIIIGQDPYYRENQAMGLSFSVPHDVKTPPSLVNIYKELQSDINGFIIPNNGDLSKWAKEGILMLNSALTVLEGKPNSHQTIWIDLTDKIIEYLDKNINHKVVFLLWGKEAQKKKDLLESENSISICSAHPSPLSGNKWFGNKSFSKTNKILHDNGIKEIDWNIF